MSNVQRGLTCRGSASVNPVAKASPNRQLCFQMWDPGEAESGCTAAEACLFALSKQIAAGAALTVRELPAANR